jgi:hypothetical protein
MNIVFQYKPVFVGRLHDQTPDVDVAQQAANFPSAKVGPEWTGPVGILLGVNVCPVHRGNTQKGKLVSSQLLLHPMKSLNIFIKVYNVNVQNAFRTVFVFCGFEIMN